MSRPKTTALRPARPFAPLLAALLIAAPQVVGQVNDALSVLIIDETYDPNDTRASAGVFSFTAIFCAIGSNPLYSLESVSNTLTNGNVLLNVVAVETLVFPQPPVATDPYFNRELEPGECTPVTYEVGLASTDMFAMFVDVFSSADRGGRVRVTTKLSSIAQPVFACGGNGKVASVAGLLDRRRAFVLALENVKVTNIEGPSGWKYVPGSARLPIGCGAARTASVKFDDDLPEGQQLTLTYDCDCSSP